MSFECFAFLGMKVFLSHLSIPWNQVSGYYFLENIIGLCLQILGLSMKTRHLYPEVNTNILILIVRLDTNLNIDIKINEIQILTLIVMLI